MKKKIIFITLLITICTLNVNATTYFGDKKASFYDINLDNVSLILENNNKYYNLNTSSNTFAEMKFENNVLIETDKTEDANKLIQTIFKGQKVTYYEPDEDGKVYAHTIEYSETDGEKISDKEIPIDTTSLDFADEINNQLYFNDFNSLSFVSIYTPEGKFVKEIKIDEFLSKVDVSAYEGKISHKELYVQNVNDVPFFLLYFRIEENGNAVKTLNYFFDNEFNLKFSYEADLTNQTIISNTITKTNNEYKMLYSDCDKEIKNCSVKVIDEKGNVEKLLSSKDQINIDNTFGLILINDIDKTAPKSYLFDNNLNLIKKYDGANRITPVIISNNLSSYLKTLSGEELKTNKFIIHTTNSEDQNKYPDKYELMLIENIKKLNISGIVNKNDNTDIKDFSIELNSKSYTLKNNGYFKFNDVKEGKQTIILKDSKGNIIGESYINIVISTETKLDGNTLYYNPNNNGININIKLSNNKLIIDSIDKGFKEEIKENNSSIPNIPETSDSLYLYISLLGILLVFSVIVIKNIKNTKNKNE